MSGKDTKRESFNNTSEKEQISRYQRLSGLLKVGSPLRDFFDNAYKYPDVLKISGIENEQETLNALNEANNGLKLIESALKCFLEIKKSETGGQNAPDESGVDKIIETYGGSMLEKGSNNLDATRLGNLLK